MCVRVGVDEERRFCWLALLVTHEDEASRVPLQPKSKTERTGSSSLLPPDDERDNEKQDQDIGCRAGHRPGVGGVGVEEDMLLLLLALDDHTHGSVGDGE